MTKTTPTLPRDVPATLKEAAAYLDVSVSTVQRQLRQGMIRRIGRRKRISCASLAVYNGAKNTPEEILQQAREAVSNGVK